MAGDQHERTYTESDVERIRQQAAVDGKIEVLCGAVTQLQTSVASIPAQIEAAMTSVAESIRGEFRPVREALLGNGDPHKSIASTVLRNTQAVERIERSGTIDETARNSARVDLILKVGIPVLLLLVGGVIGSFFS